MRKLLWIAMALCLILTGCTAAPEAAPAPEVQAAEATDAPLQTEAPEATAAPTAEPMPAPAITEPVRIEAGESKTLDINGDGEAEVVTILIAEDDPGALEDETVYYFVVQDETGKELLRQVSEQLTYMAYGYVMDADGDGRNELFFCQTYCSDDLLTKCWRSEGDTFRGLCFLEKDCETCVSDCYGLIAGFGDKCIRVSSIIDVLGTRGGLRDYVMDGDVFIPAPDSLWDLTVDLPVDDPDSWAFYTLTTVRPMAVTIEGKPATLAKGTKLLITATDAKTMAEFYTKDGVTGSFAIEQNTEEWGWNIAGEPEQDWFKEYLPYAG